MGATIEYFIGDATRPEQTDYSRFWRCCIAHCCNDIGGWGSGFVVALSAVDKRAEDSYRHWYSEGHIEPAGDFVPGNVQFVAPWKDGYQAVANIIGQRGTISRSNPHPVDYEALATGLKKVDRYCRDHEMPVVMPRLGCGLAGGDWEVVSAIIEDVFDSAMTVAVFDLP